MYVLQPQAIPPPPAPIPSDTHLLSQDLDQALLVPGDRVCEGGSWRVKIYNKDML